LSPTSLLLLRVVLLVLGWWRRATAAGLQPGHARSGQTFDQGGQVDRLMAPLAHQQFDPLPQHLAVVGITQ
jgi:hypothetical protein